MYKRVILMTVVLLLILLNCSCDGQTTTTASEEVSTGTVYNTLRSPFNGDGDWYMTQAFGAYYDKYNGHHTGEDWNKTNDDNEAVYPIATGVVTDSGLVYKSDPDYGYFVIIQHTGLFKIPGSSGPHLLAAADLSFTNGYGSNDMQAIVYSRDIFNSDLLYDNDFYNELDYNYSYEEVSTIYSVYLHINEEIEIGAIISDINSPIGTLAPTKYTSGNKIKHSAHLHFEIRTGESAAEGSALSGNVNGYYTNSQDMVNTGYREPSSIIQANMQGGDVLGKTTQEPQVQGTSLMQDDQEISGDSNTLENGTYMMNIKNGGDYDTSPADGGYVVAVDGGYMVTCVILGEASITYDEYNQLAAGETVIKTFGVETWEIRWLEEDEYEIYLEINMGGEYQELMLFSVPTPSEPELLCPEHYGEPWMYRTGEETQLFISRDINVSTNYGIEKSFDDYLETGGTDDYSGFFADYYYADIINGEIVRLDTFYGP